jgi:two-component system chemotaxis response regulator CheB
MTDIIRVLIVDDSAYVRKVIRQMLSRSPFIEVVGAARDGREALELVEQLKPDVVTCDLIMPELLDGAAFVREQTGRRPVPIIIVSVASESRPRAAALDAGAIDVVQKPTALATDRLEVGESLLAKVKAAAGWRMYRPRLLPPPGPPLWRHRSRWVQAEAVEAGRSSRGRDWHLDRRPQALKVLIPRLPADLPVPVAIVLHTPVGYTELYARKLNEESALTLSRPGRPTRAARHRLGTRSRGSSPQLPPNGGAPSSHA